MFAEGALVLVTMERFLRTLLAGHVGPDQTLPNLLELAFGERLDVLDPPGGDASNVVALVRGIRNALLHANFEQAAKQSGAASVRDYFRKFYASEIETLYKILNTRLLLDDIAACDRELLRMLPGVREQELGCAGWASKLEYDTNGASERIPLSNRAPEVFRIEAVPVAAD